MAAPSTVPLAPYRVTDLSIEDGMAIAMWRTPGPWAVQDSLESPRPDEGYWAVRDAQDRLIGFCCFGEDARAPGLDPSASVLDVALGLAPEFTGRRLSRDFAETVVEHARKVAEDRGLRCTVASWNAVGRHTAESVGFRVTGLHEVAAGGTVASFLVFQM
jgi:RimJ/RimL family protein N-acetyltransferase